jgi:DNA-binding transcriptional ArsR family regulator
MAASVWELNLFSADPRLLEPQDDAEYDRAAAAVAALASTTRLKLLHALLAGERTVTRAAAWARVPRARAEAELRELESRGAIVRAESTGELEFTPLDGHLVALIHIAIAHGVGVCGRRRQPLLLREKRRVASARSRAGE